MQEIKGQKEHFLEIKKVVDNAIANGDNRTQMLEIKKIVEQALEGLEKNEQDMQSL